jgi:hypothetical protein
MHIDTKLKVFLLIDFILGFFPPFVSAIEFATDLADILYTGNEIL